MSQKVRILKVRHAGCSMFLGLDSYGNRMWTRNPERIMDWLCDGWRSWYNQHRAQRPQRRLVEDVTTRERMWVDVSLGGADVKPVVNHPLTRPDGTVMPGISRLRRFDWKVGPDEGLHTDDYEIWERELREQAERDRFDGELRSLGALGDGESIFGRQPGNGPSSPDGDDGVSDS